MKQFELKDRYDFEDYRALIHFLRSPGGCPWDREQTHASIRRNVLEEAYETAEAIDTGDLENLKEELGDLMMQVLFHADMEEDAGTFTLEDVVDGACKKLVFRHPHVFGDVQAENSESVLRTWDQQKMEEKGQKTVTDTMRSVPAALPALWRADKILKKAENGGWKPEQSTADELCAAVDAYRTAPDEQSLGKLLFAAVRSARSAGLDPETALQRSCEKFIGAYAAAHAD